jgi:tetratricopeptide (TPR) repeat protein
MKRCNLREDKDLEELMASLSSVCLRLAAVLLLSLFAQERLVAAQAKPQTRKPIDIDKELRSKVAPDRGQSYYYYALAKWYEENQEFPQALTQMRKAVELNETSSELRVELASLLMRAGRAREAEDECREAMRLDAKNPEPYWLLGAFIYPNMQGRTPNPELVKKAVKELETMREVAPNDERSYFALGKTYFDLGEPEKAIQAYEKFQSLRTDTDAGYTAIAQYYEKAGKSDKAIEYLMKAVNSTQAENMESMMLLASLYAKLDREKEAIPLYRKMLQSGVDNVQVKRQLGAALVETGEYAEAAKVLEEVVKASPRGDGFALTQLGRARLGARDPAKAIESFERAIEVNPANLEAEFYLGMAYEASGKTDEAVKVFARLLEKTRKSTGSYSDGEKANRLVFQQHLASAYLEQGETEKAIAIYEELVKADPEPNPRQLYMLISAYRMNRQLDKALGLAKPQYEKNPKDTAIALAYARTLADTGKVNQGADILAKAVAAEPGNLDLYINLSQIYLQGKKYTDAEKALRRAQGVESLNDSDRERIKFQLASVYERQKEFDRAESIFQEILKSNPENAGALNYIGYMLADRGVRLQEAVKYVEKALEIEPNNGAYLDSLGWAFFKLNDLGQAEKYLLRAVGVVKNDPTIHDHLGDLYFKTGDYEKAQDSWNKSLAHGTEAEEIQKVKEKIDSLKETLRKRKGK